MDDYMLREAVYGDRAQRERTWRRILFDKYGESFPVPGRLKADGAPDFRQAVNKEWLLFVEREDARVSREYNQRFSGSVAGSD